MIEVATLPSGGSWPRYGAGASKSLPRAQPEIPDLHDHRERHRDIDETHNRYALGWTSRGLVVVTSLSWFGARYHWRRVVNAGNVDLDRDFTGTAMTRTEGG